MQYTHYSYEYKPQPFASIIIICFRTRLILVLFFSAKLPTSFIIIIILLLLFKVLQHITYIQCISNDALFFVLFYILRCIYIFFFTFFPSPSPAPTPIVSSAFLQSVHCCTVYMVYIRFLPTI